MPLNVPDRGGLGPNGKPSFTLDGAALMLTRQASSWASGPGEAVVVSYAFRANAPTSMPTGTSGFSRFTSAQIEATELALAAWSDVANITFLRSGGGFSGLGAYSDQAAILFGNYGAGEDGAAAFAYMPGLRGSQAASSSQGDVWVNISLQVNQQPLPGTYGLQILAHEIGHAIGLSHPSAYNAGGGAEFTYAAHAAYFEDSRQYSIMSYFGSDNTGGRVSTFAVAPQLDDIAAIQRLYGANFATRAGDTVYGFNANLAADGGSRPWYELRSASEHIYAAIWDGGGTDTLDFSLYPDDQLIDLRSGHFSNVGGDLGNVIIALGAVIERALGGSGADLLVGNAVANHLEGGGGDDTLSGGGGSDVLIGGAGTDLARMAGASADYEIRVDALGFLVADRRPGGADGQDSLRSLEAVAFADLSFRLGEAATSFAAYNLLREDVVRGARATLVLELSDKRAAGAITAAEAIDALGHAALGTTSVATLTYQFFTGRIPSQAGMDYLVSPSGPNPNNLNSAYYQSFNVENRYINFAVNLGREGEGRGSFEVQYAALTLADAAKKAYETIFGLAPSETKVTELLSGGRDSYLAAYGGDGLAGLGTKAALVGWLLAEAAKTNLGLYGRAEADFLADLADGAAFAVDLIGLYARPEYAYGGD